MSHPRYQDYWENKVLNNILKHIDITCYETKLMCYSHQLVSFIFSFVTHLTSPFATFYTCIKLYPSIEWLHHCGRGHQEDPWLSPRTFWWEKAQEQEVAIRRAAMQSLHLLGLCGVSWYLQDLWESRLSMVTVPNMAILSTVVAGKLFSLTFPEGSSKDHPITNAMGSSAPNLQLESFSIPASGWNHYSFLVVIADNDLNYMRITEKIKREKIVVRLGKWLLHPGF